MRHVALVALVAASAVACSQPAADGASSAGQNETAAGAPKLCAAIRGNGEYIVTHFASLARIVESYGLTGRTR